MTPTELRKQPEKCQLCDYLHAPKRSRCPAAGKLCNICKEMDIFESRCPNKDKRAPKQHRKEKNMQCSTITCASPWQSSEDDEDEYSHWINAVTSWKKQRKDPKSVIADDQVVYGTNQEELVRQHHELLQKSRKIRVKLNWEIADMTRRHHFREASHHQEGYSGWPRKHPSYHWHASTRDLVKFLGMINYDGKFIPNLTTVLKLLHDLTKKMSHGHGQNPNNRPSIWPGT